MKRTTLLLAGLLGVAACGLVSSESQVLSVQFAATGPGATAVSVGANSVLILRRVTLGDTCYGLAGSAVLDGGTVQALVRITRNGGNCWPVVINKGYQFLISDLQSGPTRLRLRHEQVVDGQVAGSVVLDTTVVIPAVVPQ